MAHISAELATIIMLGGVIVGSFTGFPLAFVLGSLGLAVGFVRWGPQVMNMLYSRAIDGVLLNYTFLAVPCFIFMGIMLERSGIAERLFDALYVWLGGIRGGLAVVTVIIGTIMAATVGIIAASVTMLAVVALPAMLKRGYSKSIATGSVCAGGCLGILIPPSVMLVLYGPMAQISVGKLFFGAFIPGFVLSGLYIGYILVRSFLQPNTAPAVPVELRTVPLGKKLVMLINSLLPPVFLVMSVLGVIFLGIAPPTEAAGVGAFAATVLVIAYRRFSFKVLKEVARETLRLCGFILIVVVMAFTFVGVFLGTGGGDVVTELILAAPGGRWGAFGIIMFICFLLGFFMDWIGIVFLVVPIATPIGAALGFDPLWFAMMICVNLQMSFMTPPFAYAIFIVRGAMAPELGVTTADIIRGVIPFVLLIMVGLGLCIVFPQIITWLPSLMIR